MLCIIAWSLTGVFALLAILFFISGRFYLHAYQDCLEMLDQTRGRFLRYIDEVEMWRNEQ